METIHCKQAQPLIPAWADGELSEAQAAPLREHLLSCRDCRVGMQDLRALKLWFVEPERDSLVPAGFAARVARRAFAGDTGRRPNELVAAAGARDEGRMLQFVLQATSIAALLVITLAIGLKVRELPQGDRLQANDIAPTTEQILEDLRELNAAEAELEVEEEAR